MSVGTTEGPIICDAGAPVRRGAFIGSCKHHIWEAIRASSAAPYYLDDFSDGIVLRFFVVCRVLENVPILVWYNYHDKKLHLVNACLCHMLS